MEIEGVNSTQSVPTDRDCYTYLRRPSQLVIQHRKMNSYCLYGDLIKKWEPMKSLYTAYSSSLVPVGGNERASPLDKSHSQYNETTFPRNHGHLCFSSPPPRRVRIDLPGEIAPTSLQSATPEVTVTLSNASLGIYKWQPSSPIFH